MGVDMIEGGGKLFAASRGRHVGPGHFGLLDLGEGVQKFSLHYEADLDRGGVSVLDIRPLLWRDGWPVAGDNLVAGTYTIESARTGTVLELAVQGFPVGGFRRAAWPAWQRHRPAARRRWPAAEWSAAGARPVRRSRPGARAGGGQLAARQRRAPRARHAAGSAKMGRSRRSPMPADIPVRRISGSRLPVRNVRSPPSPGGELTTAAFSGAPEQLWRIDQLTDGSYRIGPKSDARHERSAGALRRRQQHADARQIRSRQRPPALAAGSTVMKP